MDVAAADAKAAADEVIRRKYIVDRNAAIHLSRQAQLQLKRETAAAQKAADDEYLDSWRVRSKELKQEEKDEGLDRWVKQGLRVRVYGVGLGFGVLRWGRSGSKVQGLRQGRSCFREISHGLRILSGLRNAFALSRTHLRAL